MDMLPYFYFGCFSELSHLHHCFTMCVLYLCAINDSHSVVHHLFIVDFCRLLQNKLADTTTVTAAQHHHMSLICCIEVHYHLTTQISHILVNSPAHSKTTDGEQSLFCFCL